MSNSFYNVSSNPLTRSRNFSDLIRNEFASISQAFSLLPDPIGGGGKGFNGGSWGGAQLSSPTIAGGSAGTTTAPMAGVMSALRMFNTTGTVPASGMSLYGESVTGASQKLYIGRGTTPAALWDMAGNCYLGGGVGGSEIAANATDGFVHIPSCNGNPTGTPATIISGCVPMVFDRSNLKIAVYSGGAWKKTAALT